MFHSVKNFIKRTLQKSLGFHNYLYVFSIFTYNRLRKGLIEKEFLKFTDLISHDEGLLLDIGANIGVMSTLLAKRFKKATVISFEPIPDNIRVLKRIIKRYQLHNVKLYEGALSDKSGQIQMIMPVIDQVKMQGLSKVLHDEEINQTGVTYTVPMWRLDEIPELNDPSVKIIAIKMDVENYEYNVLQGGINILAKHRPLIYCELWDNDNRVKTFEMLRELGYVIKFYNNNKFEDYKGQPSSNFIFIPRGKIGDELLFQTTSIASP